jgi:hypothetical protein
MTLFTLEACLDALDGIAAPDSDAFVARVHRAYLDWLDTPAYSSYRIRGEYCTKRARCSRNSRCSISRVSVRSARR